MSLVHIIGNGFDLNAGLKTSYADFYKYYLGLDETPNLKGILSKEYVQQPEAISDFKKNISGDLDTWANLEVALGQYCNNLETSTQFDEIFEDLSEYLTIYLKSVEKKIPFIRTSKLDMYKFHDDLLHPEQNAKCPWMRKVSGNRKLDDISVLNFNYTRTIQRLIEPDIVDVMHVHGTLDDEIIIGVNHPGQIRKTEFQHDLNVTEALVKPTSSVLANEAIVKKCQRAIENAKFVSVFGSSLGPTDRYWWDLINECIVKNDLKVILFWRADANDMNKSYKPNRITRRVKAMLYNNDDPMPAQYEKNVVVATNTAMFDMFREDT